MSDSCLGAASKNRDLREGIFLYQEGLSVLVFCSLYMWFVGAILSVVCRNILQSELISELDTETLMPSSCFGSIVESPADLLGSFIGSPGLRKRLWGGRPAGRRWLQTEICPRVQFHQHVEALLSSPLLSPSLPSPLLTRYEGTLRKRKVELSHDRCSVCSPWRV